MDNGQMKKGILEMCVLGALSKQEHYGYEVAKTIRSFFPDVNESTVYGILRRLRSDGFLEMFHGETSNGPVRKYYRMSQKGQEMFSHALEDWRQMTKAVEAICD